MKPAHPLEMTLTELRYAVALSTEKSFSRAADRCSVSQPTLSVSIARLEEKLGIALFEREKGKVSVTLLGRQVIDQAKRTLKEVDKIDQIAHYGQDPLHGTLRLGVIHTVAPFLLPQLIQGLKKIAPNMPLAIEENMTARLAELLHDNQIDAAIVALPFAEHAILTRPLYDETFHVIVPVDHPWAARSEISPDEIGGDDVLLLKAGNCFRDQVLESCPQLSTPEDDMRLGHSLGTIHCMVASGLGISVLPSGALEKLYGDDLVRYIPFAPPKPIRRIVLAWRPGFARPPAIEALLEAVRGLDESAYRLLV